MSDQFRKFVLVVNSKTSDAAFGERLVNHLATLQGDSLTHVALPDESVPGSDTGHEGSAPIIVEWFAPLPPDRAEWTQALEVDERELHWYSVSEALRWRRPGVVQTPSTSISYICRVQRASGLTKAQFEQHWTEVHRPLAQKYHVGVEMYVQNVVREVLGTGGGEIDGIAELRFPSTAAFTSGHFDSDEGRAAIQADAAKFVGRASCGLYRLVSIGPEAFLD